MCHKCTPELSHQLILTDPTFCRLTRNAARMHRMKLRGKRPRTERGGLADGAARQVPSAGFLARLHLQRPRKNNRCRCSNIHELAVSEMKLSAEKVAAVCHPLAPAVTVASMRQCTTTSSDQLSRVQAGAQNVPGAAAARIGTYQLHRCCSVCCKRRDLAASAGHQRARSDRGVIHAANSKGNFACGHVSNFLVYAC